MSVDEELSQLRIQIDSLDAQILKLISERAACAQKVAEVKRAENPDAEFYRPEREADVLRRILDLNPGPLGDEEMARLFREIMSACLALEQSLKVAYLGPEGTFTQAAVLKHFGYSVGTEPMGSITEVFREVEARACQFGVVPIENSTEGVVNHTLDCFLQSPLRICGEVELRIHQHLLSRQYDPKQIKRLYSHPQSLAQCREWLNAYLPDAELITVNSNAEAARRAADEENSGAIAGAAAAELYDLQILQRNIEDNPNNTTRFLIIGHQSVLPGGSDKTTLLISTRNRPGSLYNLLAVFAESNVSLSRIESRPSHCVNWEYVFFLDIDGHATETHIQTALNRLESSAEMVKILGSYPKAVL